MTMIDRLKKKKEKKQEDKVESKVVEIESVHMTKEEIATQIFCALISSGNSFYNIDKGLDKTIDKSLEVADVLIAAFK